MSSFARQPSSSAKAETVVKVLKKKCGSDLCLERMGPRIRGCACQGVLADLGFRHERYAQSQREARAAGRMSSPV